MNLPFGSSGSYDDSGSRMRLIAVVAGVLLVAVLGYLLLSGGLFGVGGSQPTRQKIVVANQDIPAYTAITSGMVSVIEVDANTYFAGAAPSVEGVEGSMAQAPIATGQVVYTNQISRIDLGAGGNPLFMTLTNGQRAMSMSVDKITGISNLLKVGNRVDIIATYDSDAGAAVTTVMQNVTILALNQRLTNASAAPPPSSDSDKSSSQSSSSSSAESDSAYDTITFLLPSLEEGERLASAMHLKGVTLSLALRSQTDNEIVQIQTINATEVIR